MKKLVSLVLALLAASASAQVNNRGVIVKDEGSQLGFARTVNFVGSSVSCGISGGQATCTFTAGGITVGSAITSGTNGRLLYQDASGNLAQVSALSFDGSTLTIGTGLTGSAPAFIANNNTSTGDIAKFQSAGSDLVWITDAGLLYVTDSGIRGTSANTVLRWFNSGFYIQMSAGAIPFFTSGNGIMTGSTEGLGWTGSPGDASTGSMDTRFMRLSAGVVRLADATTGAYRGLIGGGAAVASATAMPLPTGRVFHVTGTTTITSITSTNFEAGVVITLIFDDALTFTDGSNLVLAGDFVTTAGDTITLAYDGTNWHETGRSVN